MYTHFDRLFAYNLWASKKVLLSLEALPEADAQCLKWFSHILCAQDIWLARILGETTADMQVWEERDLDECKLAFRDSHSDWQKWLNVLAEHQLYDRCDYKTTAGEPFSNSIADILTHVVNHSTHHRAQIVARLRQLGHTPPAIDFIFWSRNV